MSPDTLSNHYSFFPITLNLKTQFRVVPYSFKFGSDEGDRNSACCNAKPGSKYVSFTLDFQIDFISDFSILRSHLYLSKSLASPQTRKSQTRPRRRHSNRRKRVTMNKKNDCHVGQKPLGYYSSTHNIELIAPLRDPSSRQQEQSHNGQTSLISQTREDDIEAGSVWMCGKAGKNIYLSLLALNFCSR